MFQDSISNLTFHIVPLGNVEDQVDVGIVVVVGPSPDLNDVVGHLDVLRVGLEVLGSHHDDELDGPLLGGEVLVRPAPDRPDALDS